MVSSTGTGTGIKFTNRVYFRYRFGTGFYRVLPFNTGVVPVPTGTEPYRTSYIRYRYPLLGISIAVFLVPTAFGDFDSGIFGTGWYRAHQIL
ncbi:hypothetical protein Hanom_Chr02g00147791 [Helianthus anomalus]